MAEPVNKQEIDETFEWTRKKTNNNNNKNLQHQASNYFEMNRKSDKKCQQVLHFEYT